MNWKFWKRWFATSTVTEKTSPENKDAETAESDIKDSGDSKALIEDQIVPSEPVIPKVYITKELLERTHRMLASFADDGPSEGVVYWFGFELEESAVVTTLVVPDADTSWGCIRTSPKANAQALSIIVGTPLILIGQTHSHPGSSVRHSPIDDKETFASFDGAISVVVPNFGREKINLETCGIHRHIDGNFQYIEPSHISEHISVIPGEADFRKKQPAKGNFRKGAGNRI